MKKIKFVILTLVALLIVPISVNADSKDIISLNGKKYEVINKTVKYLKSVNVYDNVVTNEDGIIISANKLSGRTYEISLEEYENADVSNQLETRAYTAIETTYKRMTTYLLYNNGTYRYENELSWKNAPSVRSYDIIAIGHYSNVAPTGTPTFSMSYTTVSGSSFVSTWNMSHNYTYGSSATFLLPLPNLSSLTINYGFDVHKTVSGTVTYQGAFGDYAHGTDSSLTISEALNHDINQSAGIIHDSSVSGKFDTINTAAVYWNGTW